MPRPEKFTERVRRKRRRERIQLDDAEGAALQPAANLPGSVALLFSKEYLELTIQTWLHVRAPNHDVIRELEWLLHNAAWEWQSRRDSQLDPSLPNLGGVQPTSGEMKATIEAGAKHAQKLREWSENLPSAMFHNATVLIPGDPPLRAVITHLAHTFDLLSEMYYPKRGRQPGRRKVAQWLALWFMQFAYRHAPNAKRQEQREFVRECLVLLKIECPDPNDHIAEFDRWFLPVEVEAVRSHARYRARELAQSQD
jgi:hypothetical protein